MDTSIECVPCNVSAESQDECVQPGVSNGFTKYVHTWAELGWVGHPCCSTASPALRRSIYLSPTSHPSSHDMKRHTRHRSTTFNGTGELVGPLTSAGRLQIWKWKDTCSRARPLVFECCLPPQGSWRCSLGFGGGKCIPSLSDLHSGKCSIGSATHLCHRRGAGLCRGFFSSPHSVLLCEWAVCVSATVQGIGIISSIRPLLMADLGLLLTLDPLPGPLPVLGTPVWATG